MIFGHLPALSIDSTGFVFPWFASYCHVCSHWYNVAIRTPELWCRIPKGLSAPWIVTYLQRSGRHPLVIHVAASTFLKNKIFPLLRSNLGRVCDLSLDVYDCYNDQGLEHLNSLFQLPVPELNRFEIMDSKDLSNYRWLGNGLFTSMLKLHTLVLRQGFDIKKNYSLLNTVRHLQFATILFHQHILLILHHAPLLETLSFEMGWAGDLREVVSEVMENLKGQLPIVLLHLTFFEIPSALINDFARIFQHVEFPSSPRWSVHFNMGTLYPRDLSVLAALDRLASYVHGRREMGNVVSDLYINIEHNRCGMRGWSSGALLPGWHYARESPPRNPKLSTFDFSLQYIEKRSANEETLDEMGYPSLDELVTFAGLLPLDDVETLWISAPEDAQKLAAHIVPGWSSLLAELPNLRKLILSRSVAVGVLTAFVEAFESSATTPPPDAFDTQSAETTSINLSELILVRQTNHASSYPATLVGLLYRFLQLWYETGAPLQVLRHDLCSGVCRARSGLYDDISFEGFVRLVEKEIHCTKCGRTVRRGAFSNF